jgi:hypothetical protein
VLALPILLLVAGGVVVVGLIAALVALLLPALPVILFGLLLWAIFRPRPAAL